MQSPIIHFSELLGSTSHPGRRASQRDMARFLGTTQATINHWMTDKTSPSGVLKFFLLLSIKVGEQSPEVMRAGATLEPIPDGIYRIVSILGSMPHTLTLLGLGSHVLKDWIPGHQPLSVKRLAAFLVWVNTVMPGILVNLKVR